MSGLALRDAYAAVLGHRRRVDVVDRVVQNRFEEALLDGDGQRFDVLIGYVAGVLDLYLVDVRLAYLDDQTTQCLGEFEVWL